MEVRLLSRSEAMVLLGSGEGGTPPTPCQLPWGGGEEPLPTRSCLLPLGGVPLPPKLDLSGVEGSFCVLEI